MEQIHDRVAGLDVHRDSVAACVRVPGQHKEVVSHKERFSTTTGGLGRLAEWLGDHQVHLVGMEATGVYWKPVYYVLEDDFTIWLCKRPPREERPRSQDRHVRCGVVGRRGGPRDGQTKLCAAAGHPRAQEPYPIP